MTTMIAELRQALVEAGASEPTANAAAAAVAEAATAGDLATKADVRQIVQAAVAASEARLTWRLVAALAPVYALLTYLALRIK